MPLADVQVPVLDRAFMFGDAIYEVIRVYMGHLWHLEDHIDRLAAGLKELQINFDVGVVPPRIKKLIEETNLDDGLAYVQVTRGVAPRHHYFPKQSQPNCLVYIEPFSDPFAQARTAGGKAITFPDIRWQRNDIKATTLLANCMAADAAHKNGCIESLLIRDGFITEGSHTSVFGVMSGKVVVSPSSASVLPGITKKQVIELCASAGIEMHEAKLPLSDLPLLEELFITATPEEIIGIVQVDELIIANGRPGRVTRRLQQEFRTTVKNWLSTAVS
ncbi:MAG TPA: aminotransferase class IV [Candidatus Obscuribacterales bacterium]